MLTEQQKKDSDLVEASYKTTPVIIPVEFTVTLDDLHGVLIGSIESGITSQWAAIETPDWQPGWAHYWDAKFTDMEGDETIYEMSLDKLKRGIQILATKYPHHFNDFITKRGDAITDDCIVQCALLGDVLYG